MSVRAHLGESSRVLAATARECSLAIGVAAEIIIRAARERRKLLLCGNGGGAAAAEHLAAELVHRREGYVRGIPAISLASDAAVVTAGANDHGVNAIFARQIEALGEPGDVLLLFSTSGGSRNLLAAAKTATFGGLTSIALLGRSGGDLVALVDATITVPSSNPQHVQEAQLAVAHVLTALVEEGLALAPAATPAADPIDGLAGRGP